MSNLRQFNFRLDPSVRDLVHLVESKAVRQFSFACSADIVEMVTELARASLLNQFDFGGHSGGNFGAEKDEKLDFEETRATLTAEAMETDLF